MLLLNFNPFPVLNTERLLLRKTELSDVNEIFFLRSDKNVLQYLDRAPATLIEEAEQWIKNIHEIEKNNDGINWAIALKKDAKLIGTICFWNINKAHYRAEIGYALHPDFQHKGIMHEAMNSVLSYGFKTMKLHSVEANVKPQNSSSIKLLEKNNFVRKGYFKENFFYNGVFSDSAIYSLINPNKNG